MPLDRPARAPASALTDRVRKAILADAHRRGLNAPAMLKLHAEGDHLADTTDVVSDVEHRYHMAPQALAIRAAQRHFTSRGRGRPSIKSVDAAFLLGDEVAGFILLELPDTEFLTVVEHAIHVGRATGRVADADAIALFEYAAETLRSHGTPFRGLPGNGRFEWIGDEQKHQLTVAPALLGLADTRLNGARAEFEEALRKRRSGTPKDLEDAIDEAAKAVESTLQILHDELGVTPPRGQQVTPLFNSLVTANKIPGYVDKLIAAASGPRNNMASHGQGATVRQVPEELADASIAAAATAITLLAHYLP